MVIALVLDPEADLPTPKKGWWENESIGFTGNDMESTVQPHENALVVALRFGGFDVKRVMID